MTSARRTSHKGDFRDGEVCKYEVPASWCSFAAALSLRGVLREKKGTAQGVATRATPFFSQAGLDLPSQLRTNPLPFSSNFPPVPPTLVGTSTSTSIDGRVCCASLLVASLEHAPKKGRATYPWLYFVRSDHQFALLLYQIHPSSPHPPTAQHLPDLNRPSLESTSRKSPSSPQRASIDFLLRLYQSSHSRHKHPFTVSCRQWPLNPSSCQCRLSIFRSLSASDPRFSLRRLPLLSSFSLEPQNLPAFSPPTVAWTWIGPNSIWNGLPSTEVPNPSSL